MWCRLGVSMTAVTLGVVASVVSYEIALAARSRDYNPREMRAVLKGFGYNNVPVASGPLTDRATVNAIREFQQGYKLTVDGKPNPQTQDAAAQQVRNLQANLNLVVRPRPGLPRNQFYGPRTTAAVQQFQRQSKLQVTGIATLAVRQRLDQEARQILRKQPAEPGTQQAPEPSPSPSASPSPSPSRSPSASPTSSPSPSPSPSPSAAPSPTSSPSVTP